jgi:hypothetical protein
MTKEELLAFLKENLEVRLDSADGGSADGGCYNGARITVELYLDGEHISSSDCRLPTQRDDKY